MINDVIYHNDFYSDLFITHGGLLSKRVIENYLSQNKSKKLDPEVLSKWNIVKKYVLHAIHTHDEVRERQPILADLFKTLKLGIDIKPLQTEGDLLLRDFIVEVKQPSILSNSSVQRVSAESNDQQLIRAMKFRDKKWGLLTNSAEWQFFYKSDFDNVGLSHPFISFSLIDMIHDEANSFSQICLFINLLTSRELRHFLIKSSNENKNLATESFSSGLRRIVTDIKSLGYDEDEVNQVIEFVFKLTFIFYCEDIGVLPRHERAYNIYDVRKNFIKLKKIDFTMVNQSLKAFSQQKWSSVKIKESGNSIFWDSSIEDWIKENAKILNQVNVYSLWFDSNFVELDMSEISSSDLCDVYQNCVHYESENVGTVYTSQGLSSFVNSTIIKNLKLPLKDGDIVLDPACGSGHLLKRLIFICDKLLPLEHKHLSKGEAISLFCKKHIAGIDKNPTAIFIAKINLWLSCAQKGVSLDVLNNLQHDDTLKRYKNAFSQKDKHLSHFLDGLGLRVKAIVSNPPWSMVFGNHPDKWIATDEFWNERKSNISRQDNVAFNFTYLSYDILDPDGVAAIILPGVFFVGSSVKVRDFLIDKITAYAPSAKNSDFRSVDPSQNFGVVAFRKKPREEKDIIKVYLGIDSGDLTSVKIKSNIFKLPLLRKKESKELETKFVTNTLLPLFSSSKDVVNFEEIITNSVATTKWTKGNKGNKINGDALEKIKANSITKKLVCSENRGNSTQPIKLHPVSSKNFDDCSHKVIKLDLDSFTSKETSQFYDYFNSQFFNNIIKMLRTSKSVQSAILNIIGIPNKELASLQTHLKVIEAIEEIEENIKIRKTKKKGA